MLKADAVLAAFLCAAVSAACAMQDPAKEFVEKMDKASAEEKVPNWEHTKTLMARIAPAMGDPAPDFTLKTLDGKASVTLSTFKGDKPVVLIFGSYT